MLPRLRPSPTVAPLPFPTSLLPCRPVPSSEAPALSEARFFPRQVLSEARFSPRHRPRRHAAIRSASFTASAKESTTGTPTASRLARLWEPPV